jgi:hypothetical protein
MLGYVQRIGLKISVNPFYSVPGDHVVRAVIQNCLVALSRVGDDLLVLDPAPDAVERIALELEDDIAYQRLVGNIQRPVAELDGAAELALGPELAYAPDISLDFLVQLALRRLLSHFEPPWGYSFPGV